MTVFKCKEHEKLCSENINAKEVLENLNWRASPETGYMKPPRFLNINSELQASYYIGVSWLVENECAAVVIPKIPDIDFVEMFLCALNVNTHSEVDYFSKCYGIDFEERAIQTNANLNQLTPLLLLHFISLLEKLTKRGLKKGYVVKEENLKAKVRGKILLSTNLQKNVFAARHDKTFCRFSEYTEDILENRLLKKALLFADKILQNYKSLERHRTEIAPRLNRLLWAFENVSGDVQVFEIKNFRTNKIFREYKDAIKVAKRILRRFDYSINAIKAEDENVPPFWIDMSRLYEMYVYSKLIKNSLHKIEFQKSGYYVRQIADFVIADERLILDAKYKETYKTEKVDKDDIRELSGNARDEKLLPNLPEDFSPRCIIIYPDDFDELKHESQILFCEQGKKITGYRNFYKISVPLPCGNK